MRVGNGLEDACEAFVRCIGEGAYFEAHEALEALWFPRRFEEDDEVRLLRGFINAAVAFELWRRGRPKPARRTWGVYLKYRPLMAGLDSPCLPHYRRIERVLEETYERLFGA
jgi:hypothetical protein